MYPAITLLGKTISSYGICSIIGGFFLALFCALQCRFPRKKGGIVPDVQDMMLTLVFAVFGLLIGAKIMYAVTSTNFVYYEELSFFANLWEWIKLLVGGGMVFYGGLIGAVAAGFIYIFHYKTPVSETIDIAFAGIPLFHAFGRIGCFMGGCCYGVEYHGIFAVTFPENNLGGAPANTEVLPIQLIESGLNLVLWAILFTVYRKSGRRWLTTGLYLCGYGIMRFVLEYFRGDLIRGHLGVLSSSQVISIVLILIGVFLLIKPKFMDKTDEMNEKEYLLAVEQLNQKRAEYKKAVKERRNYNKEYAKEYISYLKAKISHSLKKGGM